jgi:hypothetical protein
MVGIVDIARYMYEIIVIAVNTQKWYNRTIKVQYPLLVRYFENMGVRNQHFSLLRQAQYESLSDQPEENYPVLN